MAIIAGLIGLVARAQAGPASASSTQIVVRPIPPPTAPTAPPQPLDAFLKWDADKKQTTVTNGAAEAHFVFNLTNVSSGDVIISNVLTSCGCTVARLPEVPWRIAPGADGQISATMNVAGKTGSVPKTITVLSDKGVKMLLVTANILPAAPTPMSAADREQNQKRATADRQAVFRGDCARCHAEPAKDKMGQQLYVAACGVCHEAEHRATMVPDLHAIPQETNAGFWRTWIAHGKPDSLMPAFAQSEGGILSDAQIASLVSYLTATIPSKPPTPVRKPAPSAR